MIRKFFQTISNRKKVDPSREQVRNLRHSLAPVKVTPRQEGAFPPTMPRQVERARKRRHEAETDSFIREQDRRAAQQARLERQARREKSGFYDGTMALANILGQRFGRLRRQVDEGKLVRVR